MQDFLHGLDWVLPLRSPALTQLAFALSWLGYPTFLLFALAVGYLAWNKGTFFRLLLLIALTALLNALLKDVFQDPRPPLELRLDDLVGASYGLPSGHAQVAVALWLWLAYEVRRLWFWGLCAGICLGVILSRLYLGAHDVEDVLGGAALGGATLLLFAQVRAWHGWSELPVAGLLAAVALVFAASLAFWPGAKAAPDYIPLMAGLLGGALVGLRLERRWLDFSVRPVLWRRLAAGVLAGLGFLLLQLLLKRLGLLLALEPLYWQALRGLLMGLFITLPMPWLLVRLGLLGGGRKAPGPAAAALG